MKIILFFLVGQLSARTLTVEWDHTIRDGTIIYVQSDTGWVEKARSTGDSVSIDIDDKQTTIMAKAYNGGGNLIVYSEESLPIVIPAKPAAPNIRVKISIVVERSDDLISWEEVSSVSIPIEKLDKDFFRAK